MAGCAAIPLHITVHLHRNCVSNGCFLPHSSYSIIQRRCSLQSSRVARLSWNSCKFSSLCARNPIVNSSHKYSSMRCHCLRTSINNDGATVSAWIPIVDQVLLMANIFLTYIAGVIPVEKVLSSSRNRISTDYALPGDTTLSGRSTENNEELNLKLPWDIVEEKLMDALNAIEHGDNFGSRFVNSEQDQAMRPLSLDAVAVGPRFRLLWASFQWLKKEVDNISGRSGKVSMNDWSTFFSDVIQKSLNPVCMDWLEKELRLKGIKPDKLELRSLMVEKLMGEDTILRNIRNSGKEGLYGELAQFLIFGSPRRDCCYYDSSLFTQHGVTILEDLVITLADGIVSVYLELISIDGNMSNEINNGLMLCTLSTRKLQKLRNEVALDQWLHQNMEAVVSMYEDRFDLRTLQSQVTEGGSKVEAENFSWWKKLMLGKSKSVSSPFRYVVIDHVSVTVKRTKELRALTGWRYYFSLFLELADITMPLIKTIFAKVSDAISFFLVCLIGRSLGLIYTGIRQSLQWKS
ncbi:Ycf55-like protein [Actinidia chinensis var. chinensis]|uniref:Ycf55-like protein n=1 Tax=Actinidia chinensis var. chinensis TaxID=1590841 RepID=A0A2R6PE75_ACTCC|nr:Ycf55-like protein [Actinidia chinensis var. chinensis]